MKHVLFVLFLTIPLCLLYAQNEANSYDYPEIDSIMNSYYKQSRFSELLPYLEAGRQQALDDFGSRDSVYLKYTLRLAVMSFRAGKLQEAVPFFEEVKKVAKQALGDQHSDYSDCLNSYAYLCVRLNRYEKAEQLFEESKNIRLNKWGKNHLKYARVLNNMAIFYTEIGNIDKAESLYLESKKILEFLELKQDRLYPQLLNNLAVLYKKNNRFDQATLLHKEAKNIRFSIFGDRHPEYATSLNNLAALYLDQSEFEAAELLYEQSMDIYLGVFGENHPSYAMSLNNLATLYRRTKQYKKAEKMYQQSLMITQKIFGNQHKRYATALNNLSILYAAMQQYDKAASMMKESILVIEQLLGTENPTYASFLNGMAEIYVDQQKTDSAFVYCLRSIDANSKTIDATFSDFSTVHKHRYYSDIQINASIQSMLKVLDAQYKLKQDESLLKRRYALIKSALLLNEQFRNSFTSTGDKLRTLKLNTDFVKEGVEMAKLLQLEDYEAEAFSFAELNKSILLSDALKGERARIYGDLPDSLVQKEVVFQKKMITLNKKMYEVNNLQEGSTEKNEVYDALAVLNSEIESFLESIKDKYPKYHALKYAHNAVKASDVQDLLDAKTALLEYFITDSVCYVFVVAKDDTKMYPIAITKDSLNNKIHQFRYALSNYSLVSSGSREAFRLYTKMAYWFYKALLQQAVEGRNLEHLIIIADGELGHIPFETFLVEPSLNQSINYNQLHYVLNDYAVSYNYAATLWKENHKYSNKSNREILACAANYTAIDSSLSTTRSAYFDNLRSVLAPLPSAQKEIKMLAEKFDGEYLFDQQCNEQYFKQKAGQYGVIHLAMHGILDEKDPMLSSMVFTENGDSTEDNFLQAYEIAGMHLNAEMVVLSACETGYGSFEQGEGILSLARSFMYSGVPSLVVSLWQVDDASTAAIMQSFYQNMTAGQNKAEALRSAKLAFLEQHTGKAAHPIFWSPFIQLGDSKTINLSLKGSKQFQWFWLLGILTLVGAGLFLMQKNKH